MSNETLASRSPRSRFDCYTDAPTGLFWLALLVCGGSIFLAEHRVIPIFHLPQRATELWARFQGEVDHANWSAVLGVFLFGVLGLFFLAVPSDRGETRGGLLWWIMLSFYGFCGASLAWSDDPPATARQLITLSACVLGATGLAKHLSLRDLCKLVFLLSANLLVVGALIEVARGTLRPDIGDYRFGGTMRPELQAINCSILVFASLALLRNTKRNLPLYLGVISLGLLFLLLTKSRIGCFAFLAAILVGAFIRLEGAPKRVLAAWGSCLLVVLAVTDQVLFSPTNAASPQVTTAQETTIFSGSIRLWRDMSGHIRQRPWAGYGAGAFWSPTRAQQISIDQGWSVPDARSGYLKLVAQIGILGIMPIALALGWAMRHCMFQFRDTGNEVYPFVTSIITLGLVISLHEAAFVSPTFWSLAAVVCLVRMSHTAVEKSAVMARQTAYATPQYSPSKA